MADQNKLLLLPVARCALLDAYAVDRAPVERFIRASYHAHYDARLGKLPPCMFVLYGPAGEILAAAGLRPAKETPVFLEHYIDQPIETALQLATGKPLERDDIIEVSSLAVLNPGFGRVLIRTLTAFLYHRRFDWVVFTAVSTLRNTFHRLGLDPRPLCIADPARLPPDDTDWGRYYDNRPLVMYGNVPGGYAHLQRRLSTPPVPPLAATCDIGRVRA